MRCVVLAGMLLLGCAPSEHVLVLDFEAGETAERITVGGYRLERANAGAAVAQVQHRPAVPGELRVVSDGGHTTLLRLITEPDKMRPRLQRMVSRGACQGRLAFRVEHLPGQYGWTMLVGRRPAAEVPCRARGGWVRCD